MSLIQIGTIINTNLEGRSMTDLLMLGLVPGTNIQITFGVWLWGITLFILLLLIYVAHRKKLPTSLVILLVVYFAIRNSKLELQTA